jgi:RNA polymerase sigma-70 factor (ECF subfamily)
MQATNLTMTIAVRGHRDALRDAGGAWCRIGVAAATPSAFVTCVGTAVRDPTTPSPPGSCGFVGAIGFRRGPGTFPRRLRVQDVPLVVVANPEPRRAELDDVTLARAQRGDESAWRALVERYQRPVFALLSRMLSPVARRDLVEDLAQDTFLRAFRALASFDRAASGRLSSWLLTIATRLALDELRRRRVPAEALQPVHFQAAAPAGPDRRLLAGLTRAVEALSPDHRAVILLREVHGLDYEEIAAALAISVGTVRSRLSRARAELRAALPEGRDG